MKIAQALILVLLWSTPFASAHHSNDPTEEKIHQYILDHPEVILEALERLSAREEQLARAAQVAEFPSLFTRPPVLGLGSADAPRRVVEFFDYKCIPCRSIHARLEALVATQPDIRIEMRQLPILTPASERATRFAFAVWELSGDAAYVAAHEALWAHIGPYNTSFFSKVAQSLSLDEDLIEEVMWSDKITAKIDENRDMAIALGIVGTPSFVTPTDIAVGTTDLERLTELFVSQ